MPIYDFLCESCGPFEERRPLEERADSAACPACDGDARRLYSMPNVRTMPAALSNATHRAEKSAHEPEVARHPRNGMLPGKRYRPGGGDHHGH